VEDNYKRIKRIFPKPEDVMKPLVQKIYKQILHPFLKEVEKATTDDGGGNEYLNAVEQAYVAVQVIEKRLEAYPLGDLDLHSLTADLFPELNNGSNAECYFCCS